MQIYLKSTKTSPLTVFECQRCIGRMQHRFLKLLTHRTKLSVNQPDVNTRHRTWISVIQTEPTHTDSRPADWHSPMLLSYRGNAVNKAQPDTLSAIFVGLAFLMTLRRVWLTALPECLRSRWPLTPHTHCLSFPAPPLYAHPIRMLMRCLLTLSSFACMVEPTSMCMFDNELCKTRVRISIKTKTIKKKIFYSEFQKQKHW